MLQNIRKNIQGTMAKIIVGLIVATFALFGVESILTSGGISYVAEVNGEGIPASELQQEINQQKRRLLMSMGENIDPAMLDDQRLAGPALEFMIQKKLLLQNAGDLGLAVSDTILANLIGGMEAFQADGRFNEARYRLLLGEQGYSPASFQQSLREDVLTTQVRMGVTASEFVTPQELAQTAIVAEEQRDLRYLVMPLDSFRDAVAMSDEQIQSWYEANADRFQSVESVITETIELSAADFMQPVDEALVEELYEAEKAALDLPERRAVSHILLTQADGESDAELEQRAGQVLAEVTASDASFADLAKRYSEDLGSANFGGELGFTSGDSFPAELEEAIAELQLGAVSGLVRSEAGIHILTVTAIEAGEQADYAAVRQGLEQRLMEEAAQRELVTTVEDLRDQVFNAENLTGPADALGLRVNQGVEIFRDGVKGPITDGRVVAAAFSSDVLNDGFSSDVIELEGGRFVVLRVTEHKLPQLLPLAEVRAEVVAAATEEIALANAETAAAEIIESLKQGQAIDVLAQERGYDWQVELAVKRDSRALSPSLLQQAFTLEPPAEGQTRYSFATTAAGDIEIFELVRVSAGEAATLAPARRDRLVNQMLRDKSRSIDASYQRSLRAQADIVKS